MTPPPGSAPSPQPGADPPGGEEFQGLRERISSLEHEVELLRSILRQARDIIITTDLEGRITNVNEEAEQVLGYSKSEVLGKPAGLFFAQRGLRERLVGNLGAAPDGVLRQDVQVRTKAGKRVWLGLSLSWLLGPAGERLGTIGVSKEITARRKLEEQLRRLSITDKLTGLYNQSHFFSALEVEKERAIRLEHELSLLLFDLDGFKELNDTRGHREGDKALYEVGCLLFRNIRKEVDSAYRYGGDEFTVLLPGATVTTALTFAERIRNQIEALPLGLTASMGICPFARGQRHLQVVEKADQAMYRAKAAGGNRVAYFDLERGEVALAPPQGV